MGPGAVVTQRPVRVHPGPLAGIRRWLLSKFKTHPMWRTVNLPDGGIEVLPVNDWIDHDVDGEDCICHPGIEIAARADGAGHATVVFHHALDGRS